MHAEDGLLFHRRCASSIWRISDHFFQRPRLVTSVQVKHHIRLLWAGKFYHGQMRTVSRDVQSVGQVGHEWDDLES